jgi:ornithine carbamoyltransferase
MTRHLLEVDELTHAEMGDVLDLAEETAPPQVLAGRTVALLFEKPSARTRSSASVAAVQLGGNPVVITGAEVGLDSRETVEDVGRTLACYHAAIGARVFEHSKLERMAAALDESASPVPVVNLLSDRGHPCQALADLLTLRQRFGELAGRTVAYVGDGNNVCRSLVVAAALTGVHTRVATPPGYELDETDVKRAQALGGSILTTSDPREAVSGADAVYTDVWASMGQEDEAEQRRAAFAGFTVDELLMALARPEAVFLHCLPAHRGEEVSAEVIDGPRSVVWQQAANRMHSMRGLLLWLLAPARAGVAP